MKHATDTRYLFENDGGHAFAALAASSHSFKKKKARASMRESSLWKISSALHPAAAGPYFIHSIPLTEPSECHTLQQLCIMHGPVIENLHKVNRQVPFYDMSTGQQKSTLAVWLVINTKRVSLTFVICIQRINCLGKKKGK
jgi:hypothetical protein